ncbi:MAG: aminotransferase class III-fold pyridoxal phosphate-dependent enzyme [Chloroflexota bacterium]|nr:aminotransferase class III-fold pyridoxal phosphate-dependent enzyme [Chloroflexota bacterium]
MVEFEGLEQVAVIITEPIQNAGGCISPGSVEYFQKIQALCDRTGILMIMDEVICGFGRLGYLFGSTYFGVEPDLITTAKGITSSYAPLGAVLVRKSVADAFLREGPGFLHGLTFGGHPVSCAAALANLDIMLEEDLPGRARETGAYLRSQLEAAFADHPNVGDIRGAGLFLGVELVEDRETKATFDDSALLARLTDRMREQGLILRNDDRGDPTTQLCPLLVITREECDQTVEILAASFDELGKKLGSVATMHALG